MAHSPGFRIILDAHAFSEEFLPLHLGRREAEQAVMERCLDPVRQGRKPIHLWLYGGSGSGKTAVVRDVLARLRSETDTLFIVLNCWERDSLYEILDQTITEMKVFRAEAHRVSVKLERLRRFLGGRCLIFVLDEIDRITPAERAAVLYHLASLDNVGLICISNTLRSLHEMEERVQSRLAPYPIAFGRYSEAAIADILLQRANTALAEKSFSPAVIRRIAALSGGDARVAIQTLRKAAEAAERERQSVMALSDVESVWPDCHQVKATEMLAVLTEDHRMIFQCATTGPAMISTDLWQTYLQGCRRRDRRPVSMRTFSSYINQLTRLGLICCERARLKGNVRLLKPMAGIQVTAMETSSGSPGQLLVANPDESIKKTDL